MPDEIKHDRDGVYARLDRVLHDHPEYVPMSFHSPQYAELLEDLTDVVMEVVTVAKEPDRCTDCFSKSTPIIGGLCGRCRIIVNGIMD